MAKKLLLACLTLTTFHLKAADLTGNYTGCGEITSLGKRQAVLVLVKMPTGFASDQFRYTAGFYWQKGRSEQTSVDFFTNVLIDDSSSRIFMSMEMPPLHDFGTIVKTLTATILADGSIQGEGLSNSTGGNGVFQRGTFTVHPVQVEPGQAMPELNCD